jgi:hypothetical protein
MDRRWQVWPSAAIQARTAMRERKSEAGSQTEQTVHRKTEAKSKAQSIEVTHCLNVQSSGQSKIIDMADYYVVAVPFSTPLR